MPQDLRVDAYLATQPPFAQAILERVRAAMALARPGAAETIKWSRPFWVENGATLAMMCAFKAHATFGPWRPAGSTAPGRVEAGWGRVTDVADLPDVETLARQLADALATVETAPVVKRVRKPAEDMAVPADVAAALEAAGATGAFDVFPPSARADYLRWFADAKRPETRARRIADGVGWIAQGKRRNWRYDRG